MAVPDVAEAIVQLAEAIENQTRYLDRRDTQQRDDWLKARDEDLDRADRRRAEDLERFKRERDEDWQRALVIRGIDLGGRR